ncbi:MAG: hypothetical protein GY778_25845, partial [bacterium]|nr:hypothetical protein [bacterium]
QWVGGAGFLRVLSLAPLIDPFSRLGGEILKVYHRDRLWIISLVLTLLTFAFAGLFLIGRLGPIGMAWANYLPVGGAVMAWGVYKIAPAPFLKLVRNIVVVYLAPVLPFLAAFLAAGDRPWLRFGLSVVAALATTGFYWWKFGGSFVAFFRGSTTADSTPVAHTPNRID